MTDLTDKRDVLIGYVNYLYEFPDSPRRASADSILNELHQNGWAVVPREPEAVGEALRDVLVPSGDPLPYRLASDRKGAQMSAVGPHNMAYLLEARFMDDGILVEVGDLVFAVKGAHVTVLQRAPGLWPLLLDREVVSRV